MRTLSLLFEDWNEHGKVERSQRIELQIATAIDWCESMCGDDDIDDELRFALLEFIARYAPEDLFSEPL